MVNNPDDCDSVTQCRHVYFIFHMRQYETSRGNRNTLLPIYCILSILDGFRVCTRILSCLIILYILLYCCALKKYHVSFRKRKKNKYEKKTFATIKIYESIGVPTSVIRDPVMMNKIVILIILCYSNCCRICCRFS